MRAGQRNIDTSSGYVVASSIMKDFILKHEYRTTHYLTEDSFNSGNKNYAYEIMVEQPINKIKAYQITVTVRWEDSVDHYGKGGNLEASISTIVEDDSFGNIAPTLL